MKSAFQAAIVTASILSAFDFAIAAEPLPTLKLPPIKHPRDNPPTDAKVELGKKLFFDSRLSRNEKVSCATCHDPAKGWSNGARFGVGVDRRKGHRNVPTLFNVAFNKHFFWDGRASSLEQQALEPIKNQVEMDVSPEKLATKLNRIAAYRRQFREVFDKDVTPETIAKALATFQRSIVSNDVPLDRFLGGDETALSKAAQRGMKMFFGDARCHICHSGPNFTDQKFHNVGISIGDESPDLGRAALTKRTADRHAFKTPTLREVAHTAPYMHDGSFDSLEQIVKHYNFGAVTNAENPNRDEALEVLYLSEEQVSDLVTFLKEGLSNPRLPRHSAADLPR